MDAKVACNTSSPPRGPDEYQMVTNRGNLVDKQKIEFVKVPRVTKKYLLLTPVHHQLIFVTIQ